MLETILEYFISQGPAWVIAGIVGFAAWRLLKWYQGYNEKLLSNREAQIADMTKKTEARLDAAQTVIQEQAKESIKQQQDYSKAWAEMTAESLKVQGEFTACLAAMRTDFEGALDAISSALQQHSAEDSSDLTVGRIEQILKKHEDLIIKYFDKMLATQDQLITQISRLEEATREILRGK